MRATNIATMPLTAAIVVVFGVVFASAVAFVLRRSLAQRHAREAGATQSNLRPRESATNASPAPRRKSEESTYAPADPNQSNPALWDPSPTYDSGPSSPTCDSSGYSDSGGGGGGDESSLPVRMCPDMRVLSDFRGSAALSSIVTAVATVVALGATSSPVEAATTPRATTPRASDTASPVPLRVANANTRFELKTEGFIAQLDRINAEDPDVILLQETAERLTALRRWSKYHDYYLYAPGSGTSTEHESTVLIERSGRFSLQQTSVRLASRPVARESGGTIPPRYITTVRVLDRASNRSISFSSTHVVPEVQFWPPDKVTPRYRTETLKGARQHYATIRAQQRANQAVGAITILGGDLNTGVEYEGAWEGFPTRTFGSVLVSNHEALGRVETFVNKPVPGDVRAIDYVFASRDARTQFVAQKTIDTRSDHHAMIVDLAIEVLP